MSPWRANLRQIFICITIIALSGNKSQSMTTGRRAKASDFKLSQTEKPLTYVDVSSLNDDNDKGSVTSSLTGPKLRHNLPECATQQVCNALFVRMNHTQRLCDCPSNYNWECSADPNAQDGHTIELTRRYDKRVYTQVKLCEPLISVRTCKLPTDWTLLALQSERSGKAHYVVVCRCPEWAKLEGPYTHTHPPYARIPGIRVYGMLCAQGGRDSRDKDSEEDKEYPEFPWDLAYAVLNTTAFSSIW